MGIPGPALRRSISCFAVIGILLSARAIGASPRPTPLGGLPPGPEPAWSTIHMRGTAEGLCRVAGIREFEPARLPLEIIRLIHGERITESIQPARVRLAVSAYLTALDDFSRAVTRLRVPALGTRSIATENQADVRAVATLAGVAFDAGGAAPWRDLPAAANLRRALSIAGLRLDNLAARLNQGETIGLDLPRVSVPLPLPARLWRDAILTGPTSDDTLFSAIVRDRTAALVYHGLFSLDAETLDYFAVHPQLLSVARGHPGAFAACARSIHVHAGRPLLAGGPAAEPLWAALAGTAPAQASDFVTRLFDVDHGGRLAYFYDAVAHLDPPHQRFALGLAASPAPDLARFSALYSAFTAVFPAWQIEAHPFTRFPGDGLSLLGELAVDEAGRLAAPSSAALWQCALANAALPTEDELRRFDFASATAADAASIAQLALRRDSVTSPQQRIRTVLFGQRVFGKTGAADAPGVCAVLRGFPRFGAVALVFERMGIDAPATYAVAMRHTARLSALGSPPRVASALAQFQGALAMIDRLVFQEVVEPAQARHLVESLVSVPVSDKGYRGELAAWILRELMPVVRARTASASVADEDVLLEALAGPRPAGPAPATIEWEGQQYRFDPAAAELARLLAVRRKQGGLRLDVPLVLQSLAATLGRGRVSAGDAQTVNERLNVVIEDLRGATTAETADRPILDLADKLSDAGRSFRSSPGSDAARQALAAQLTEAADETLPRVLRALAYAAAIGNPDSNLFLGPDMAIDHEFGASETQWSVAEEQAGAGVARHLRGSLLALDVPLARYSLRRVSADVPLQASRIDIDDVTGLAQTAVLKRPSAFTDAARDEIVALVERGRRQAGAAATPDARLAIFQAANVDEWRRNALVADARDDAGRLQEALTLTELFWIGVRSSNVQPAAQWGVSMTTLTGCLCLRLPGPWSVETRGVRPSAGLVASHVLDPTLRVAELTAELKLPAALIPALLVGVTEDVLDSCGLAHPNDWTALADAARRVTRERFEDQVAALTVAGGPLVPAGEPGGPR